MIELRSGKQDVLQLEHVPLHSRVVSGLRMFEPKRTGDARAAFLTNRAVARHFGKAAAGLDPAQRAELGTAKVAAAAYRDETGKVRIVYREAIVRFEPGTSEAKRKAILAKFKLKVRAKSAFVPDQVTVFDPRRYYVAEGMIELANDLTATEEIAFAFPNFVSEFRRLGAPRFHAEQWHLKIIQARKAWRHTRGQGITIAILDDGVDIAHPSLRDNIRRRPDPSDRRDRYGRDFFVDENGPDGADHFDPRPKIFRSPFDHYEFNDIHGTCCAGVAAANGRRANIRGVAPDARILPVKVFHGDATVPEARVAAAIHYASRCADILSISWEGPRGPHMDAALHDAGDGRRGKGCPIFAAAGNEDATVIFPATSQHAIAVGASTHREKRAHYSNHGRTLSIVAPSGAVIVRPSNKPRPGMIISTDLSSPRRGFNLGSFNAGGADGLFYNKWTGTSSSAPLCAGIAALMLSANPNLTRDEVRSILEQTAEKIGPKKSYNAKGHSQNFGFGRVNAARAVTRALQLAGKRSRKKR